MPAVHNPYAKTSIVLAAVGAIGLAVLAMGIGSAYLDDRFETYHPTLQAAQENQAIERGWIPAWIPPSARDIHEVHDRHESPACAV